MAIEINKPEPLKIGTHYHYTLSSYEPVSITITVPTVTDADVEFALESIAHEHGTSGDKVDDAWVQENLGAPSLDALKKSLHSQLEHMNSQYAEESKAPLAARELALRLNQSVPVDEIAKYRNQLQQSMAFEAAQQGIDLSHYLAQLGVNQASMDAMLDDRAAQTAGEQAALSAYAEEKKLKVVEDELPRLLQLTKEDAEKVVEQARGLGQLDDLMSDARNVKAANVAASEATCTYAHETPEEAKVRSEQYHAMLEMMRQQAQAQADESDEGDKPSPEDKGFKLVD